MSRYLGLAIATGRAVTDLDHVRQSVADILLTPIGSRIERREYGSDVPALIDQPLNDITSLRIMAAVVAALVKWEPRLRLSKVELLLGTVAGQASLIIYAELTDGVGGEVEIAVALGAHAPAGSLLIGLSGDWLLADAAEYLVLP